MREHKTVSHANHAPIVEDDEAEMLQASRSTSRTSRVTQKQCGALGWCQNTAGAGWENLGWYPHLDVVVNCKNGCEM